MSSVLSRICLGRQVIFITSLECYIFGSLRLQFILSDHRRFFIMLHNLFDNTLHFCIVPWWRPRTVCTRDVPMFAVKRLTTNFTFGVGFRGPLPRFPAHNFFSVNLREVFLDKAIWRTHAVLKTAWKYFVPTLIKKSFNNDARIKYRQYLVKSHFQHDTACCTSYGQTHIV